MQGQRGTFHWERHIQRHVQVSGSWSIGRCMKSSVCICTAFQVIAGPLAAPLTATSDQDYLQESHSCALMREEESPLIVGIN